MGHTIPQMSLHTKTSTIEAEASLPRTSTVVLSISLNTMFDDVPESLEAWATQLKASEAWQSYVENHEHWQRTQTYQLIPLTHVSPKDNEALHIEPHLLLCKRDFSLEMRFTPP